MMRGKQISYGNRLNVICSPRGTFIDLIKGPPTPQLMIVEAGRV